MARGSLAVVQERLCILVLSVNPDRGSLTRRKRNEVPTCSYLREANTHLNASQGDCTPFTSLVTVT